MLVKDLPRRIKVIAFDRFLTFKNSTKVNKDLKEFVRASFLKKNLIRAFPWNIYENERSFWEKVNNGIFNCGEKFFNILESRIKEIDNE